MSSNQPDKNLITRYLNGELSGMELENFRERMQADEAFKNEVGFQHLLRSGIMFSNEAELKEKILTKIKFRKTRIPFALKLIFTFLIITGIGITLWFYVGTDSSNHNKGYLFFPFISKEKDKKSEKKMAETKSAKSDHAEPSAHDEPAQNGEKAPDNLNASEGEQNQPPANDSLSQVNDEDKNLVVKKEQLLISASIPVIEKPATDRKSTDASLAHETAEKLNPSAGVPEEEKASANYQVEFWISPINYRGYKMSKNKLILYGIEEPDAVKLYRMNDVLFMKYGNEFFRLVNTFDFLSYQRLKENDVPLAIRQ